MIVRFLLLFFVLVSTARSIYGLEDLLGLPVDYDEKHISDSFLNDWNDEEDIWKEGPTNLKSHDDSTMFLKKICQDYQLKVNNKEIDCESITMNKKTQSQHSLRKRDIEEATLEEGSGEAEHEEHTPEEEKLILVPATPQIDTEEAHVEDKDKKEEEEKKEEETENKGKGEEKKEEETENKEKGEEKKEEETENKEKGEEKKEEQPKHIEETIENNENQPENKDEQLEHTEEVSPKSEEESKPSIEIGPPVEQSPIPTIHEEIAITEAAKDNTEPPKASPEPELVPEHADKVKENPTDASSDPSEKETAVNEAESDDKRGRKLIAMPDDLAEEISPNQSGAATDESLNNAEEAEKNIPKGKIKAASIANMEEPNTGESSNTTTDQGRKDTRLLIGLLVAVLAVGTAAFVYNYVRKKKRVVNRAQNGTTKSDIEEGREMKPLMRTPQPQTSNFKDDTTVEVKS